MHDLERNNCNIISLVCLHMFFGVVTQNVVIDMSQNVFCMTLINIQMSDDINLEAKENDEHTREDDKKGSKILLCLSPINKSKWSYVNRDKKSAKLSNNKKWTSKNKNIQCKIVNSSKRRRRGTHFGSCAS